MQEISGSFLVTLFSKKLFYMKYLSDCIILSKKRKMTLDRTRTHQKQKAHRTMRFSSMFMVAWDGIEPPTRGFSVRCSTN